MYRQSLIFFLLFITISYSNASELTIHQSYSNRYNLSGLITYFCDSTDNLNINEIIHDNSKFIESHNSVLNFRVTKNTYWFKCDISNQSDLKDWILEIDYPNLNSVTVYLIRDGQVDTTYFRGLNYAIEHRLHNQHSNIMKLNLESNQTYQIFVRVKTESFLIVPIELMTFDTFIAKDRDKYTILNVLYGIIIALICFNFILFILTREKNYLLLTIFMLLLSMNAYFLYGYGFRPSFNFNLFWEIRMKQILFGACSFIFILFTINYLNLQRFKYLYKIVLVLIYISVIYTLSLTIQSIPNTFITFVSPILYSSGGLLILSAAIYTFIKKERMAIYYILAFSIYTLAAVIYSMALFNWIEFNFITFNINAIGITLFGLFLTIGLIEKITAIKQERAKASHLIEVNDILRNEINERINTEEALRESEEKFRLLFELSPQPIAISFKSDGFILDVNDQMEKISGISKSELIGSDSLRTEIISTRDKKRLIDQFNSKDQIQGVEMQLFNASTPKTCLVYVHSIFIQNTELLVTVLTDITELRRQQKEIKSFSTAVEQSANAIVITKTNGEIEYANPSFSSLTGYTQTELKGNNPSILKSGHHEESFYQELWETILSGETWSGEFYNRKKDGSYFWDYTTISPIIDEQGEIIQFIAIKEDVTQKKIQDETLIRSEKQLRELNATKDKFFSIVAHDLMNPFNAMLGFAGLLSESIRQDEKNQSLQFADVLEQSTRRIYALLQNLLLWSKSQSGKIIFSPSSVSIAELIMSTIHVLNGQAQNKNIQFNISIDEKDSIYLDQNMISTVLRNLITNAIKYSPTGETISITVTKNKSEHLFKISDQGIGISPQVFENLFQLEKAISIAENSAKVSTGLGLVLSNDFVKAHQGRIWVESQIGKGSDFYFAIPFPETK